MKNILDIYFKEDKNLNDYEFLEKEIEENFQITYKKYIFLEDNIFDNFNPEKINMKLNWKNVGNGISNQILLIFRYRWFAIRNYLKKIEKLLLRNIILPDFLMKKN